MNAYDPHFANEGDRGQGYLSKQLVICVCFLFLAASLQLAPFNNYLREGQANPSPNSPIPPDTGHAQDFTAKSTSTAPTFPPSTGNTSNESNGSPEVIQSIHVGAHPQIPAYDPDNGLLYVPNDLQNNVSVINGTSVVSTIAVGHQPDTATYDSKNKDIYVTNSADDTVTVISGASNRIIANITVGWGPTIPLNFSAFDPQNGLLYIPVDVPGDIVVINGTSVQATISVTGTPIYDAFNGYIYVLNSVPVKSQVNVTVIDGTSVIAVIWIANTSGIPVIDQTTGLVYVPESMSNYVEIINGTHEMTQVTVGLYPWNGIYDPADGYVYIENDGGEPTRGWFIPASVTVLNRSSVQGTIGIGQVPGLPAFNSHDETLYFPCQGSNNVSVIHGLKVVSVLAIQNGPSVAIFDQDHNYVYIIPDLKDNLSIISDTFPVAFVEHGLPPGSIWNASLFSNELSRSGTSTARSIDFMLPGGNYSFAVTSTIKPPVTPHGSIRVNGSSVNVSIEFLVPAYVVEFFETGLPDGAVWSVTFGGALQTSQAATLNFSVFNGSYSYRVGAIPGFTTWWSGFVNVNGAGETISLPFARMLYSVSIIEVGLPYGTEWSATLGSDRSSAVGPYIQLSEPNGTYSYVLRSIVGWSTQTADGSLVINGSSASLTSVWSPTKYEITFDETGLPFGSSWWVNLTDGGGSGPTSLTSLVLRETSGSYSFEAASTDDLLSAARGDFSVDGGPVSVKVVFSFDGFGVAFEESGLPVGSVWSLTFDGRQGSGSGQIVFSGVSYGTHAFTVATEDGFKASPASGSVLVDNENLTHMIEFTPTQSSIKSMGGLPLTLGVALGLVSTSAIILLSLVAVARKCHPK